MRKTLQTISALLITLIGTTAQAGTPKCNGTCEPDPSSPTYQQNAISRTLVQNQRGHLPGPAHRAGSDGTPAAVNPGSGSYSYAIPVIHLPGRDGLDLNLVLYYNSHVWNTTPSSSTLTLNADRDFPDYGFRLDFGYIEGPFSNAAGTHSYILTEADGAKRELMLKSGTTFESNDATYMDYDTSTKLLLRRDGTRWQYALGSGGGTTVFVPIQIKDTNGNFLSITYVPNPGPSYNPDIKPQDIATVTDTLGRVVTYNYNTTHYLLQSVSAPALGTGTQNYISFTWGTITLNYNFAPGVADSAANGSTINIITACAYPNGTGYTFTWGDWATITQIARTSSTGATRASVSYNFPTAGTQLSAPPTFTQQTVYDGVHSTMWTYSATLSSGVVTQMTVTDPNSTVSTTNFNSSGWQAGLPSSSVITNGSTTLRTVTSTWTQDNLNLAYPLNPRVTNQFITLGDTGQQAQVGFSYDAYGNLSQVQECDWGPVPARTTQTTFLSSSSYLAAHIYNLPSQVKVFDGSGNLIARTDYSYDPTILSNITGATNHDDQSYGSGNSVRGNVGSVTRYTNAAAGSGAISKAFSYDSLGNLLTAQVDCCQLQQFSFSNATQYAYPASVTRGANGGTQLTTSFTYDFNTGLLLSINDPNQKTTSYHYDSSWRTTQVTRPDNAVITTSFDDTDVSSAATTTAPIDSSHSVSQTVTLDGAGRTLKSESKSSDGSVDVIADRQFDSLGRLTQSSNPHNPSEGQVWTTYSYDVFGRLLTSTPPGSAGSFQYSYSGNQTVATDPAGLQRRTYTDAFGRLVEADEPGYDDGGHGAGSVTISGSEQSGQTRTCSDYVGSRCISWDIQYYYDSGTVSISVNGFTENAYYDQNSTASSLAAALASAFNSNFSSPVTATASGGTVTFLSKQAGINTNYPLSASTSYNTGSFNAPSFPVAPSGATLTGGTDSTGGDGHPPTIATPYVTTYTYDPLNDLTLVIQGVQNRTFNYDSMGRLTSATTPEAGTAAYTYNSFGLALTRNDARGEVTNYSYDSLNRLTQVSYTAGSGVAATAAVNFTYDAGGASANALGRLTGMSDGVGSESYQYNTMGNTTQVSKTMFSSSFPLSYTYNLAGELTSIGYPSGRVVQSSFDPVGRLAQVQSGGTNYVSNLAYNSASEPTGLTYGNGVQVSLTYNSRLQLASLGYANSGGNFLSLAYSYGTGNNGQIQQITDNVDSGRTASYTYDVWGRLKTAATTGSTNFPAWGLSWTYDRFGNRKQQTVTAGTGPSNSVAPSTTTNRITDPGYSYDAAGNMTSDAVNTLVYDGENRITSSAQGSSASAYSYDGNGLRVKKVPASGATTVYLFSGTKVIAEYDNGAAPSSPSREYIYAGSQMVAKIEGGAAQYYHQDHLSVRAMTDSNGNITLQQSTFPFGENWYQKTGGTKWQFTTYERDPESGNDYAMARYYVNRLGRFNAPDPIAGSIADPQTLNRYAYVRNDPVNGVDPSGLCGCADTEAGCSTGDLGGGIGTLENPTIVHVYALAPPPFDFISLWLQGLLSALPTQPGGNFGTGGRGGGSGGGQTKGYTVSLKVLNDCLASLGIDASVAAFKTSIPGGNGYAIAIGTDRFSSKGPNVPIVVTNDAASFNAAQLGGICGVPTALGCTLPGDPYNNYTNNNNNPFGTASTQVHELGHSLFKITSGSNLIPEPNGEVGKALEDCVNKKHGIQKN
jgi:RHS repeat-associated protein